MSVCESEDTTMCDFCCIFASVKKKNIKSQSETRVAQKKMIMNRELNPIMELRYRIKRYQAMGNGTMCQSLNLKLRRLMAAQAK